MHQEVFLFPERLMTCALPVDGHFYWSNLGRMSPHKDAHHSLTSVIRFPQTPFPTSAGQIHDFL